MVRGALLLGCVAPLLGCPHLIFAPTVMGDVPSFSGSEPAASEARLVPLTFDFRTEGRYLVFRLRVDGQNLEPSAGSCRRWWLQRVARVSESARRSFCANDFVLLDLAAGAQHTLELVVASEHTVARRVVLRPGPNVRWRVPIRSERIELPAELEPGYAYTLEAREERLAPRKALAQETPSDGRWDLEAYDPRYRVGVEVGSLRIRLLRDADGRVLRELSAPLYSGRLSCEPPFCP